MPRKVDVRFYAINGHGRQRLHASDLDEIRMYLTSHYWRSNPPHKIVRETREEITL